MSKKLITAAAAATLGAIALSTQAVAGVTATGGVVSSYIFRGAEAGGASAFAQVDYAHDSGLSAGVWAIDAVGNLQVDGDGDGIISSPSDVDAIAGQEFDLYVAYTHEFSDDLSASIGYTSYQYTGNGYSNGEVNVGVSFQKFALAYDMGEYDHSDIDLGDDTGNSHASLSYAHNENWTFTVGQVDPLDADAVEDDGWAYLDMTVAGEVSDVDAALSIGFVDQDDLSLADDGYITLSVSKTFDGLGLGM